MNRRDFLKYAGAGMAAAWVGPQLAWAADKAADRPNIIFILSDDYGIGGVGCYGAHYKTPNLDALAAQGMRFEHCFSMPLCGPSRATCLMGRYPFRTGVVSNGAGGKAHPDRETTVAKVLRQAGYATAVAGKWNQLEYFKTIEDGRAWGFDEFMIWSRDSDNSGTDRYWSPAYNRNGDMLKDAAGKYGPDLLHDFAVDFIRRHKDQPFFLYYPMVLIHAPILRTPDSADGNVEQYAANIEYQDKLVGKLVEELDRLGLREKTLIVFAGDNGCQHNGGGELKGRPIDGGKGSMKEGGSRVPLICHWKGVTPQATVCRDLVDFSDFMPTFAEVAGAQPPDGVILDGHSFAPQVRGQAGTPREWVYVQLGGNRYVRSPEWKLDESGQLLNMREAPFKETPVAADDADPAAAAARKQLQAALDGLGAPASGGAGAVPGKANKAGKGNKSGKAKKGQP